VYIQQDDDVNKGLISLYASNHIANNQAALIKNKVDFLQD